MENNELDKNNSNKDSTSGLKIRSVQYNFIMNFILTASNFIFPLITFPYVSRVIGAAGTGHVSFVSSYAAYFTLIAQLGIPTYGVRACARVRDNREKLSKTTQEILLISIIMSVISTAAYIISILTVPSLQSDKPLLLITSCTFILTSIGVEWFYKSIEQYDYITMRSILFKIISVVLMFIFVHASDDYIIYGAITVIASVGSNVFNIIRLHKFVDLRPCKNLEIKKHIRPIMLFFAQSAIISIYTNLDVLMLKFISNYDQVGYYNAALRVQATMASLVSSLGTVLLPRMSYYVKANLRTKFISLMAKGLNCTMFIAAPLALFMAMMAPECLAIMSGNEYLPASWAMRYLAITTIFVGLTNIIGIQVLTPLQKEKYVVYSVIGGAVTDLVLNLFFIKLWGSAGAALSTLICEIIVLIIQLYFARDLIKHLHNQLKLIRYIVYSIIASVPIFFLSKLDLNEFIKMIIAVLIFAAIYLAFLHFSKDAIYNDLKHSVGKKLKKNKKDTTEQEYEEPEQLSDDEPSVLEVFDDDVYISELNDKKDNK